MTEAWQRTASRKASRSEASLIERRLLLERGFAMHRALLAERELGSLRDELGQFSVSKGRGGVRGLLSRSPRLRELARGAVGHLASSLMEGRVRAVKLTLFDKTREANWTLPLHQDRVIAVEDRKELEGFGPWSIKGGQPHAQAPAAVLSKMLAIRVHLDDATENGGALRVISGSHARGILSPEAIADIVTRTPVEICPARAGDAFAMRPLLLHGSSNAERPSHRRVLHFEFTSSELPLPLRWPRDSILVPEPTHEVPP